MPDDDSVPVQRPSGRVWLAALLPLVPVVCALAVEPVPTEQVMKLDGDWRLHEGDLAGADAVDVDDARDPAWQPFTIPGGYSQLGHTDPTMWIRRHFTRAQLVEAGIADRDLFLMLGNVRSGFARVTVNGRYLGEKGVEDRDLILEETALDGWAVPRALLTDGDNVVAIRLHWTSPGHDGVPDRRVLLGPSAVVKSYLDRATAMKHLLEDGALALALFSCGLLAYLLTQRPRAEDRDLYRSSILVNAVVVLYLLGKTGVVVGFFLASRDLSNLVTYCVIGIALATPELVESYYVRRTTRFRVLNRAVCALAFLASLIVGVQAVYPKFSGWLFAVIVHAIVHAVRDLRRPRTALGPVLASAIAVTSVTAACDLLNDLNIVFPPRLFSYGVANLGIISAVLVIGELLRLSRTLQGKNVALVDALARAEETARLKSEFLANTSHELRTPLNAIMNIPQGLLQQIEERSVVVCGACGALFETEDGGGLDAGTRCPSCDSENLTLEVRRFAPTDGDALAAHLRSILGAGQHLLAVVNDILDFSKLDAGRMNLVFEDVRARVIVERALETVAPVARAADVSVTSFIGDADDALMVRADPVRMAQVLINLMANAVKFSSAGSTVDVRAAGDGAGGVILSVKDRGTGIAPEHHAMIFESFRQIEGGHTRKHGGTGLGLAIVKKIVDLHGGTIHVDSALGSGSTFTVRLPRAGAALSALSAPGRAPPRGATGTTSAPT